MLRKSTMLALAAVAALGLAVSNANAKPGGPGIGNQMPGNGGPGTIKPGTQIKPIGKPVGVNWPSFPKPKYPKPILRPIYTPIVTPIYKPVPVVVSRPVYVAARPVSYTPGPCTCLSKEYTQEGAVVFKDRCTAEMAINPPAVAQ